MRALFQLKASLGLGPWDRTELCLSAGRGFHSNDGRAGLVDDGVGGQVYQRPPLLVRSAGYELDLRTSRIPHLTAALTVFQTDFDSELVYNADVGQTEAGRPAVGVASRPACSVGRSGGSSSTATSPSAAPVTAMRIPPGAISRTHRVSWARPAF